MKGFEIFLNNQKIKAGVKRGVVTICLDDARKISIGGLDRGKFQWVNWVRTDLGLGDKIKIVATEVEEDVFPVTIEEIDKHELLDEYYKLKEMLIKEGRLK